MKIVENWTVWYGPDPTIHPDYTFGRSRLRTNPDGDYVLESFKSQVDNSALPSPDLTGWSIYITCKKGQTVDSEIIDFETFGSKYKYTIENPVPYWHSSTP